MSQRRAAGQDGMSSYRRTGGAPMVASRPGGHIPGVIRLNPIPWLFAPGIALAGYLFDGPPGAAKAVGAWVGVVGAATIWVVVRRRWRPHPPEQDSIPPPPP